MCGVAGYVDYNHQPQKHLVAKMLQEIAYRGPDQTGIYIEENVALGIQRLSIIDLKTGNQPMQNSDKTITVVFNGEIYNFLELKQSLKEKGHKFKTKSDTEVLIHAYKAYGFEMPKYLKGMFAFAIWDKKKNLIFISRDPSGIKPLYYLQKGNLLLFGSELKTILIHPQVKKIINLQALKTYSSLGYIFGESTIFENIHKLLPGQNLIFSKKGKQLNTYYELKSDKIHIGKNIDSLLEKAVMTHSISDVPIGILLSGGIDSSLVAYYLTKNIKKGINTFSINFEEKSFDESLYANAVAKQLGTKHHFETFNSKDVLNLFNVLPVSSKNYPKTEILKEFIKGMHYPPFKRHLLWMSLKNYNHKLLNNKLFSTETEPFESDFLKMLIT